MSYKNTLNIPKTEFPMRASLVSNESKFKDFWNSQDLYRKLSNVSSSDFFVVHDGPPYANGNIHLGHALNKVLKDFVLRYKSLRGYAISYVPGWDTHGLPIENKVEQRQGYGKLSVIEKRTLCREYALQQIQNQKEQFLRLHLLSDFKQIYRTLDPFFINNELNNFCYLLNKGFLYWDLKPVAWSWSSQTALAESEINYKPITSKSIYFCFSLQEDWSKGDVVISKGCRFLIWTTTPYTLEANLAIAVNPKFTYEIIKSDDGYEYICLRGVAKSIGLQGEVISVAQGKDLEGAVYLNHITNECNKVILAGFVVEESGTGIVHVAPGFGLEDYYVCKEQGISIYVSIDERGFFKQDTKFSLINGLFYTDASDVVIDWLSKHNFLFKEEMISHNIGHDWRTQKPLFYMASPQWFLDVSKLKKYLQGSIENKVKSSPSWLSKKLEELILGRKEWCISRQRVWGTPIPILFYKGTPILDSDQVKWIVDLIAKEGVDIWFKEEASYFLKPELFDKYELEFLTKSGDILDVWFDSGCSWNILPGDQVSDLYLEGFDQLRGWFNSSSIVSMALNKRLPFKSLLSHGFVLDNEGNKMSKSKGNVIDPIELVDKYGTDVIRLWIGLNNFLEDIKISEESLQNAVSIYRKIRNTLFRYSLSILPKNFEVNSVILKNLKLPENIYIYQAFIDSWKQIEKHLDNFHFFKAIKSSIDFLNVYSGWYLEICKDTLYCNKTDSWEYEEIINIVGEIFEKSLFLYSIFIPQTAEEAWRIYRTNEIKSIFLHSWPKLNGREYVIDSELWSKFWNLRDQIYLQIENLKNKKEISGPLEARVTLTQENQIDSDIDLVKLLNVGEIVIGKEMSVRKSILEKCERCNRHKSDLNVKKLCCRCAKVLV